MTRLLLSTPALTTVAAAAGVSATALATIALSIIHGVPVVNVAAVLLLPLGLAAGLLTPRRHPAKTPRPSRVAVPVVAPGRAPGAAARVPSTSGTSARARAASHVTAAHTSPGGAVASSARARLAAISPGRATAGGVR